MSRVCSPLEAAIALSQKDAPTEAFDCGFAVLSEGEATDRLLVVVLSDLLRLGPCDNGLCRHCRAGRHNIWFSNIFKEELRELRLRVAKHAFTSSASLAIDVVSYLNVRL